MQKPCYFDIETGPSPQDSIQHLKPTFEAAKNIKDPDKIKAHIAEQEQRWLADGALSALTGQVIVIGKLDGDTFEHHSGDERLLLMAWWAECGMMLGAGRTVVGFCCKTFDLPFLIRRSWLHGVPIPWAVFEGRYFSSAIQDLAEKWSFGNRDPRDRISLDNLSKFLGVGQKNGDGKDFASLWATDRAKALEYLHNDLKLTQAAYERMTNPTP